MAERGLQEVLQPALLDRLTDDAPETTRESRDKRVIHLQRLRECVLRDLAWLLNTGNLESVVELEHLPEIRDSVLNYGIPEIAGGTVSNLDAAGMERALREAIARFEPRILKKSLRVRVVFDENEPMSHNAVTFIIQGELYADPAPLRLSMKTEVDLETGAVSLTEDFA